MKTYTVRKGYVVTLRTPIKDKEGNVKGWNEKRLEEGATVSDSDPAWEHSFASNRQMHKLAEWDGGHPEGEKREKPGHETRPAAAKQTR